MSYDRLARDQAKKRSPHDWTEKWDRLGALDGVREARAELDRSCAGKRISIDALRALDARLANNWDLGYCLAFAGNDANGRVVAIKYRPLSGSSHDSWCEKLSDWLRPIVAGNRDSLAWLVAEGETDAARLYDLVGDRCAVMVLPTGAKAMKPEWATVIPRGATVGLCHDADLDGDRGAELAARIIGGRTVRIRPPVEGCDWCEWDGDREAFLELVSNAVGLASTEDAVVVTGEEFAAVEEPGAEPIVGETDNILIPEGGDGMAYGDGGASKTTLLLDLACHVAAGDSWLGIPVPKPRRVLWIENEGPRPLFRKKLKRKLAGWRGSPLQGRLRIWSAPWGRFSFASDAQRVELAGIIEEQEIDMLVVGPLTRVGMDAAGTLQEVAAFTDLVSDVRWRSGRRLAVLLIHHENRAGTVSGAW